MKKNELQRQKLINDMASFLESGGRIESLPQNCSAGQNQPLTRKKKDHISHVKRSDPGHPAHSD